VRIGGEPPRAVILDPDGRLEAGSVSSTPERLGSWRLGGRASSVAVPAGGDRCLVALAGGEALSVSLADGQARPIATVEGRPQPQQLAVTRDGARLAVAASDGARRTLVQRIDVATGAVLLLGELADPVTDLAFTPDGAELFTTSGRKLEDGYLDTRNEVVRWDATAGGVLARATLAGLGHCVDVSPSGEVVWVGLNTRRLLAFDRALGEPTRELVGDDVKLEGDFMGTGAHAGAVRAVRHLRGDRLVSISGSAVAVEGNELRVWVASSGKQLLRIPLPGYAEKLGVSDDGRFALVRCTPRLVGDEDPGTSLYDLDPR
jgi:hypothetical protein